MKCYLRKFNFSHGFERNYYASATCCCKSKFRTDACVFCKRLERGSNWKVLKICMERKDFPLCDFVYNNLNNYLEDLPGDGFFYFVKEDNMIRYKIDNPKWGNFFKNKETM